MGLYGAVDGRERKRIVLLISGRGQNDGRLNGMERLEWRLLDSWVAPFPRQNLVIRRTWSAPPADLAEMLIREGSKDCEFTIVGFSWGGNTAAQVVRELKARNRFGKLLVLVDAVRWFGLLGPWSVIRLPVLGVGNKLVYRQEEHWPYGSHIRYDGSSLEILTKLIEDCPHSGMDDNQEIQDEIVRRICDERT